MKMPNPEIDTVIKRAMVSFVAMTVGLLVLTGIAAVVAQSIGTTWLLAAVVIFLLVGEVLAYANTLMGPVSEWITNGSPGSPQPLPVMTPPPPSSSLAGSSRFDPVPPSGDPRGTDRGL